MRSDWSHRRTLKNQLINTSGGGGWEPRWLKIMPRSPSGRHGGGWNRKSGGAELRPGHACKRQARKNKARRRFPAQRFDGTFEKHSPYHHTCHTRLSAKSEREEFYAKVRHLWNDVLEVEEAGGRFSSYALSNCSGRRDVQILPGRVYRGELTTTKSGASGPAACCPKVGENRCGGTDVLQFQSGGRFCTYTARCMA